MTTTSLHPALSDLLRPVEPDYSGIRMRHIGCWECAKHGLFGYGTLRQLKNAIARKQRKGGK